jgi:hypothetical protein
MFTFDIESLLIMGNLHSLMFLKNLTKLQGFIDDFKEFGW